MSELHLVFWYWWILAVVLVILEAFAPGAFFLWMGVSASLVGVLLLLFPGVGWEFQVLVFALLSVLSIVAWRRWQRSNPDETDHPTLNRRGEQYVGRVLVLAEAIENGYGRVRVDDTGWRVQGPECAAGSTVRVVGVDGTVLRVECVDHTH